MVQHLQPWGRSRRIKRFGSVAGWSGRLFLKLSRDAVCVCISNPPDAGGGWAVLECRSPRAFLLPLRYEGVLLLSRTRTHLENGLWAGATLPTVFLDKIHGRISRSPGKGGLNEGHCCQPAAPVDLVARSRLNGWFYCWQSEGSAKVAFPLLSFSPPWQGVLATSKGKHWSSVGLSPTRGEWGVFGSAQQIWLLDMTLPSRLGAGSSVETEAHAS